MNTLTLDPESKLQVSTGTSSTATLYVDKHGQVTLYNTNEKFGTFSTVTPNYEIREELLEGRPHIVVPVVMMVEGVHNGSAGPIFHKEEELSRFVEAWNGIPVTVSHPKEDGQNVSANSPRQLAMNSVGRIFNAHYDGGLKGEAWIDVEKIQRVSPDALAYIRQGRPLDVSVGVFNETDAVEGEWRGEHYNSVARNYRPDHLALLPGEQGACSWADGCGIRANQKGEQMNDRLKSFKEIAKEGYLVSDFVINEGYQEISQLLQNALDAMDTNMKFHFLEEIYDNDFVYRVRNGEGGSTLYRRGYSVNNGTVTLADNPTEVRKKVDYVTMVEAGDDISNHSKGDQSMSDEKTLCCEAKVEALIANKETPFTAADKEKLMGLGEDLIDRLTPAEKPKEEDDVTANTEAIETFKSTLKTVEDFTAIMPAGMKEVVEKSMAAYKAKRDGLVKTITDNSDKFEKETLEALDDKTLAGIAESITKKPVDYSGMGSGGKKTGNGEVAPLVFVEDDSSKKED